MRGIYATTYKIKSSTEDKFSRLEKTKCAMFPFKTHIPLVVI